jgi:hypothetical protein
MTIEAGDGGPDLQAHDIGSGGMLASTTRPRWPGQHLQVRFKLPRHSRAIRATCRVLDLVDVPRGVGLSLQFLQLAPKAEIDILRFVGDRLQTARSDAGTSGAAVPA